MLISTSGRNTSNARDVPDKAIEVVLFETAKGEVYRTRYLSNGYSKFPFKEVKQVFSLIYIMAAKKAFKDLGLFLLQLNNWLKKKFQNYIAQNLTSSTSSFKFSPHIPFVLVKSI